MLDTESSHYLPRRSYEGAKSCHHDLLSKAKLSSVEIRNDESQYHENQRRGRAKRRIARIQELPLNEVSHENHLTSSENIRDNECAHHRDEHENCARHNTRHR